MEGVELCRRISVTVERSYGWLKSFRRIAIRCERLVIIYKGTHKHGIRNDTEIWGLETRFNDLAKILLDFADLKILKERIYHLALVVSRINLALWKKVWRRYTSL